MRTNAMLCRAAVAAAVCSPGMALAQDATTTPPATTPPTQVTNVSQVTQVNQTVVTNDTKGAINFLIGPALLNMSKLNDSIKGDGYGKVPAFNLMLGGHAHAVIANKLIIGGTGAYFLTLSDTDNTTTPASKSSYDGGWGGVDVGIAAVDTPHFALSPMLTLGGYSFSYHTHETGSYTYNQALAKQPHDWSLSQGGGTLGLGGLLVGLSVPIEFRIQVDPTADDRRGLLIGLRPGGLLGFQTGDWKRSGIDAKGGPTMGLQGGYLMLEVGAAE